VGPGPDERHRRRQIVTIPWVLVNLRVSPGSKATGVGGRYGTEEPPVLVVRVAARAVDGRANAAVVDAIAEAFGVPRRDVRIVHGATGRRKVVAVDGGDPGLLASLLSPATGAPYR